jgi:putative heme iron utilization protein
LAHYEDAAKSLLKGVLERDPVRILGVLGDSEKKEWPELIQALCQEMSQAIDEGTPEEVSAIMAVWPAVRKILDGRGSILVAADALLPQDL